MASVSSSTSSTNTMITPSSTGNTIRITGMASGLDVDATVKKMMAGEQIKVDKANQALQTLQWKQSAYQDIISGIKDLQNSFFDVSDVDTNILSSSNYAAFDISGNDAKIGSITPGVGAQTGNYTLNVAQIAAGASSNSMLLGAMPITSISKLTDISKVSFDNDATENSILGADKFNTNLKLVLDINGGDANKINGGQTLNVNVDNSTGNLTVKDLLNQINSQGNGVIKASYSELTRNFTLTTTATGQSQTLQVNNTSSAALQDILQVGPLTGQSAKVSIQPPGQGAAIPIADQSSNNFTIDGMNYNLAGKGSVTVNVTQNTQKVYDKFKSFIDKYNTLVDKIETKLTESKNYDYKPLTDAQKTSMTQDQITAWNAKAQSGLLNGDVRLQKMLDGLRSAFSSPVNGVGLSLGSYGSKSFGLDTSADITKPYEINIVDPGKLKAAIAQNPDQFIKMFTNVYTGTIVNSNAITSNDGTNIVSASNLTQIGTPPGPNAAMQVALTLKLNYGSGKSVTVNLDNTVAGAFSGNATVSDLITAINAKSNGDFVASFDDTTHKFTFTNKVGGNNVSIDSSSDQVFKNMIASLTPDPTTQFNNNGIFTRVQNIVQDNIGRTGTYSNNALLTKYANFQDSYSNFGGVGLNSLPDQLYAQNVQIKNLNDEFQTLQTKYYDQFSKLETALTQMQAQSASLTSMMGG